MTPANLRKLALAATPGPWKWDGDVCAYDHEQEAPWLINERGKKVLYGQIDCDNSWSADLIAALSPERVLALLDERKGLAKDAERYRWLVENRVGCAMHMGAVLYTPELVIPRGMEPDAIDAAIDAARSKT